MTEAEINGAFWLVGEGSHGNKSVVPLSNGEARTFMCVVVLGGGGGAVSLEEGPTQRSSFTSRNSASIIK